MSQRPGAQAGGERPTARRDAPGAPRAQDGRARAVAPGKRADAPRAAAGRPTGRPPERGASREEIEQRAYDPRREERRKASRIALPEEVDPRMLDPEARKELRTLARETADLVARHLVVTGRLLDEDPAQALVHARAARAMAGRVGVVREAAGLAAYAAGEWAEGLSELRAARRITGSPEHLAVMADCERALGRPERALAYADDPDVPRLTQDQRVELVIVVSGARRDLSQADAAVLALQEPAQRTTGKRPWAARLWYAYADALLDAGRVEQARDWFARAADVDAEGATDAADRILLLDGYVLEDLAEDDEEGQPRTDLPTEAELAEYVRGIPPSEPDRSAAQPSPEPPEPADTTEEEPAAPKSGVAPPTFAEPPGDPSDGELRLFD